MENSSKELMENAWKVLTTDEQTAITLAVSFSKSSWEGGEIMKKSHFKYLEILDRAHRLLEIFTDYFDKYPSIIHADIQVPLAFKEYLSGVMWGRKKVNSVIRLVDDKRYLINSARGRLIGIELQKLKDSKRDCDKDLFNLILEFDRWNNFRILPEEWQEPSAFKRRNKRRDIKHIQNILSLPIISLKVLEEDYRYTGKYPSKFLGLVSPDKTYGFRVIQVRDLKTNIEKLSKVGLPLFNTYEICNEFCELIYEYATIDKRTPKYGHKFWAKFRELIALASNYKHLENINSNRAYLQNATDSIHKKKKSPR